MAKLTVVQAAKAGWASRQRIYRRIKSGKLSAEIDADERVVIDTSELVRVFGDPVRSTDTETPKTDGLDTPNNTAVQAELVRLRADLERERERADRLLGLLETAQRSLTDQRPGRSWWSRLLAQSKAVG